MRLATLLRNLRFSILLLIASAERKPRLEFLVLTWSHFALSASAGRSRDPPASPQDGGAALGKLSLAQH